MNFTKYFKKIVYLFVAIGFTSAIAGSYEDFFKALQRNDGATVGRLLERGFDPNSLDTEGRPALCMALQLESGSVVAALLRHPQLDVNALNDKDESPLMLAALKDQRDWMSKLLERGAVVNKAGWTPLHYAASNKDASGQAITLLLDAGAAINAPSPNGTTPLMMAAMYGSEAGVKVLMARGADLKRKNDLGLTVADFADRAGRDKLAAQLRAAIGS